MSDPILPGATLGILGGGQLGRMLAIEARRLGYRVVVYTDAPDSPAGEVANEEIVSTWDDETSLTRFAGLCDVVTYEFENIPLAALSRVADTTRAHPSGELLHTTQNRLREKHFLSENGLPVTRFIAARSAEELAHAIGELGDAIVKTAAWGYDGKGQARVSSVSDAETVWSSLDSDELIVEKLVPFDSEVSVVIARDAKGETSSYEVTRNHHVNGILDISTVPSGLDDRVESSAKQLAHEVATAFDLRGLLCVEMFVVGTDLLINEIAPRPHNSGHWTIDAAITSQFEQQLRAVCGLPLGDVTLRSPVAMVNLLGEIWQEGEPDWTALLARPGIKIHLYGKREPRPGRKMGHLTVCAASAGDAETAAIEGRNLL